MPTVSVIILPFRRPQLIPAVFSALLGQTYKNLEIIAVINDATDGSSELLAGQFPSVKRIMSGFSVVIYLIG